MSDLSDFDIDTVAPEPAPRRPERDRGRSPIVWVVAVVLLVALGAAAYWWFVRRAAPEGDEGRVASEATVPERPLGGDADAIDVPPLDEADPLIRKLVAALSSHPAVAAWLTTNGLIRNFVVVVENISTGALPSRHLRVLRPAGPFRVRGSGAQATIDPRSYDRYTGIADAVATIDAMRAARLYASLKPRLDEAYAELGRQEPFDRALERAIVVLLRVPAVTGDVRVVPEGATEYRYADARLEQPTAPQKQLLRMGPRNVGVIQGKLREIALALGIPAERLP